MFERLINSFGKPANQQDIAYPRDAELQLAAAILLFAVLPVDYRVTAEETCALRKALTALFKLSPEKCQRMIARAAAAHDRDPNIVAATTMLKRLTSESFRHHLLAEINIIMRADGVLHDNELDLEHRVARLLGLTPENIAKSA
jgi:uncharacterized tellurite resistance protein B-like protein